MCVEDLFSHIQYNYHAVVDVCYLLQLRFSTQSDRTFLLIGLSLAFIHALTITTLWILFSNVFRNFANHRVSYNYFHCINQVTINCSNLLYCSAMGNQTGCCFDHSSYKCIETDQFLQNMDYLTIYVIICGVVVFFFGWGHSAIFRYTGDRQMLEIRKRLFSSIIQQNIQWFDTIATEEITSRMIE